MSQLTVRFTRFIPSVLVCVGTMASLPIGWPAENKRLEPNPVRLLASSNERPNPRSPFWVAPRKLGFVTEREIGRGQSQGAIYFYDLRTKSIQRVYDRPVLSPRFLPHQNWLSFVDVGKSQSLTLFTMRLADREVKEYESAGIVFDPSWSPDGRKVVFAGLSYDANLVVLDLHTDQVEELGDLGRGRDTEGTEEPDWSPTGREIVYIGWDVTSRNERGDYNPKISHLYKFEVRTRNYRGVTDGPFQDRYPEYSPDGKYIAFVSNRSGHFELWSIRRDGKNMRRVTDMASSGFEVGVERPAWSPDGRRVAFSATPVVPGPREEGSRFRDSTIWVVQFTP